MTRKLYYEDCHMSRFMAHVTDCRETEKGYEVTLDATAFYPEGGGQACDIGTLGGAAVLDVQERGEEVIHLCAEPLEVGAPVEGVIDFERRFDLMQQHTGEHIVSGIINRRYGYHNVGFHMGKEFVTIDFDGMIDEEGLREIERRANEAVWADLQTEVLYPDRETLAQLDYRSKRELEGQVRLVRFPGVDLCACCGTHVLRTGEIGLIRLFSCVKFREGVRIEMLCGGRCLDYLNRVQEQNHQVSVQLSAKPLETGEGVRRVLQELADLKLRVASMEDELFRHKAESLQNAGNVLLFEPVMAPDSVRKLCDKVLSACGGRCAVFAGSDGDGWKYAVGDAANDLRPMVKAMNAALRGRGGGKPNFVQGSVSASKAEIEAFFEHH